MTHPPIHQQISRDGYIHMFELPKDCPFDGREIGTRLFHGHIAALSTARGYNERAGAKVKRVVMSRHHFRVIDTLEALLLIEDLDKRKRASVELIRTLMNPGLVDGDQQPYIDEIGHRIFQVSPKYLGSQWR